MKKNNVLLAIMILGSFISAKAYGYSSLPYACQNEPWHLKGVGKEVVEVRTCVWKKKSYVEVRNSNEHYLCVRVADNVGTPNPGFIAIGPGNNFGWWASAPKVSWKIRAHENYKGEYCE